MPIGSSERRRPRQPPAVGTLELNNSYYLIKIHDAQVFFAAGPLTQARHAIVSSTVSSSYQSSPTQSIYQVAILEKNAPTRLGLNVNLTDWLPAIADASLNLTLRYSVVRGAPFRTLVDQIGKVNLAAKVSLVQAEWAVAVAITSIAGNLLSYFLQEGQEQGVFDLKMDLPVADLQSGYYAVIGSATDEFWPEDLLMSGGNRLTDLRGKNLDCLSYVVIQVLALPRRLSEAVRRTSWGELLQTAREQFRNASPANDAERQGLRRDWLTTVKQVQILALKDSTFLSNEINEVINHVTSEVERKLQPSQVAQAGGLEEYPEEWQKVLGVRNSEELYQSARDYQDAQEISRRLLAEYERAGYLR